MELRQLEAFVSVLECGGFSKAAERLRLSQPTVSAHVAALERELQVKLFTRTTKELAPSDAGRLLYDYAVKMLALRESSLEAIHRYTSQLRGVVTVAASTIPGQYLLPGLLRGFRQKYPGVTFRIQLTDSQGAVSRVAARDVEIGFCGTMLHAPRCSFRELLEDQLVIVTPNTEEYRRYQQTGFPLHRLQRERLISREEGSGTRKEAELFLREMGLGGARLQIAEEVTSNEQIQDLVSAGRGVSIISRTAVESGCQSGRLLAFDFKSTKLRRKLYILRYRSGELSPAAKMFFDYAEEACWKRRRENRQ